MSNLVFGAKQPYEEYFIEFDFVNDIDDADSIESAEVTVMDGDDDVTDTLTGGDAKQSVLGTKVSVWIKGGTTGTTYTITCKIITTVLAEKYEAESEITVTET